MTSHNIGAKIKPSTLSNWPKFKCLTINEKTILFSSSAISFWFFNDQSLITNYRMKDYSAALPRLSMKRPPGWRQACTRSRHSASAKGRGGQDIPLDRSLLSTSSMITENCRSVSLHKAIPVSDEKLHFFDTEGHRANGLVN
jgi:hypothetical protein